MMLAREAMNVSHPPSPIFPFIIYFHPVSISMRPCFSSIIITLNIVQMISSEHEDKYNNKQAARMLHREPYMLL